MCCRNIWYNIQNGEILSIKEPLAFCYKGLTKPLHLLLSLILLLFASESFASGVLAPGAATITINSYTVKQSDYTINTHDALIVNDTLIVMGNLTVSANAELVLNAGAVCIVYGNLDLKNRVNLEVGAHLIVGGNLTSVNANNTVSTDSNSAVYVLGTVEGTVEGLTCPEPSEYTPETSTEGCNYGNIISLEDNENDSTGIYDLFVSGDVSKGVSPVYTMLCGGEPVTISALYSEGYYYQWCDSIGNHLLGENSRSFVIADPGEYFVKIVNSASPSDTVISHRAKVVTSNLSVDFLSVDDTCSIGAGSIIFSGATGGSGSYEYSINGGTNWQTSESFTDLTAGTFDVRLRDAASPDCEYILDAAYILWGDTLAPTFDIYPEAVFSTPFDTVISVFSLLPIEVYDNCSGVSKSSSPVSVDLSSEAVNPVTVGATDASGNSETAAFEISVQNTSSIQTGPDLDTVCAGSTISYTFNGSWGSQSKWIVAGPDATITDQNSQTTDITFNVPGTYIIKAKIQDGGQPTFYLDYMTVLDGSASVSADVSISASPSASVCNGTEITFTATSVNGGANPAYQWLIDGVAVSGETNATFISSQFTDGDVISCEMTSSLTCVSNNPDTSNVIVLEMAPTPDITLLSNTTGACDGDGNATLTYSATSGGADRYSIDFADSNIPDVTNATLTGGSISLVFPANTSPGSYSAALTVINSNTGCISNNYSISVVIHQIPDTSDITTD
uniref:hypothetical protein n=1 Tax=uncultured Draconibacterium sp. TaxID=1573823 RepID=UPI003216BCE2